MKRKLLYCVCAGLSLVLSTNVNAQNQSKSGRLQVSERRAMDFTVSSIGSGTLHVALANVAGQNVKVSGRILNAEGKEVRQFPAFPVTDEKALKDFDVAALPPGRYKFQLSCQGTAYTQNVSLVSGPGGVTVTSGQ